MRIWSKVVFATTFSALIAASPEGRRAGGAEHPGTGVPQKSRELPVIAHANPPMQAAASDHEILCKPGEDNRRSDLCAQWKAADWTQEAVFWAKWQFWLALAGTGALLWNIKLTRDALRTAAEANENTEAALAHAKQMASLELRPYLFVDAIEMRTKDLLSMPDIAISIRNFGSTPATYLEVSAGLGVGRVNADGRAPTMTRQILVRPDLPQGKTVVVTVPYPFTMRPSAEQRLFCSIQFTYKDKLGGQYGIFETYGYSPEPATEGFHFYGSP